MKRAGDTPGLASLPTVAPDTLTRAGLRRVLIILCLTQVTSWGVLYYAFPVLAANITADTGWSTTSITAAFSLSLIVGALVGIPVGKRLDRFGPRRIMTAGSAVACLSIIGIGLAPTLSLFYLAWTLAGISMAAVFYQPAFAALTRWWGARQVTALTAVTLAGGLASTIFAPTTAWINSALDWRHTYIVLAAALGLITIPAHWFGLRGHWPTPMGAVSHNHVRAPREIVRSQAFFVLAAAMSLSAFALFAAMINIVALMLDRGYTPKIAALTLGIGGIGQVAGRLGYKRLSELLSVRTRMAVIFGFGAAAVALQSGVAGPAWILIGLAVIAGAARGITTLLQATAITDRWGAVHYGHLSAVLGAPVMIAIAIAPVAGSALAHALGSYPAMFAVLAGIALLATTLAMFAKK